MAVDFLPPGVARACRPAASPCRSSIAVVVVVGALSLLVSACSPERTRLPPGTGDPDQVLFERGNAALNAKKWLTAREYFRQIVDGYPQSAVRADAKLGLGDTYVGEGSTSAYILAINEFREFLTFYPTHPRADHAQFKLAMSHYRQMAKPERDQTETKAAIAEFEAFFERYPSSALMPEARAAYREAKDRLGQSDYRVGLFYYRARWYPGAIDRFKRLLEADPEFTHRDAVYYYLGESLMKSERKAEALPWFERLTSEFAQSEHLADAQKRVAELRATLDVPKPPVPPGSFP
jgi:outer membrane protein assembly factor BamD